MRPEKHSPYFNLLDAFKEKHCPLCYLARKAVTRSLDSLLYEHVNDPGTRMTLRKSYGFCEKHYWQVVQFNDGFGTAILAKDLLDTIKNEWRENPKSLKKKFRLKQECLACETWSQTEKNYLELFLENLDDTSFLFDYERSFGLCLAHFRKLLTKIEDETKRTKLLEIEIRKMESLIKELEEFTRKHDYRFSHEGFGEERDAWLRAVEFLKGRTDLLPKKQRP